MCANRKDFESSKNIFIRDLDTLFKLLGLPDSLKASAREAASSYPLLVTKSYVNRMKRSCPDDPLLLQVLPDKGGPLRDDGDGNEDPLNEKSSFVAPNLLQKYPERALLITTTACAISCRFCFRRFFADKSGGGGDFEEAFKYLKNNPSIKELILSGGDPFMLSNESLKKLFQDIKKIRSIERVRVHTRIPIVWPERINPGLISILKSGGPKRAILVVHSNHPNEIQGSCASVLRKLTGTAGLLVFNQSVLLKGINDSVEVLKELSERLISVGVVPYYLHQLDKVKGARRFEVPVEKGLELAQALKDCLPGYAVPRYVRETPCSAESSSLAKTHLL